jgi:hypothetical protein
MLDQPLSARDLQYAPAFIALWLHRFDDTIDGSVVNNGQEERLSMIVDIRPLTPA